MVLKLSLSAAVILCCAFIGRAFAKTTIRRAQVLLQTVGGLKILEIHTLNNGKQLSDALRKSPSNLLRETGLLMNGCSARSAWDALRTREAKRGGTLDSLASEDFDTLDTFFDGLGSTGSDEQKEIYDAAIKVLDRLEVGARKDGAQRIRLYTTLGVLGGFAIVIGFI